MSLEERVKKVNESVKAATKDELPPQGKEAIYLATSFVLVIGTQLTRIAGALEEIAGSLKEIEAKEGFKATDPATFADLIRERGADKVVERRPRHDTHDPFDPLKDKRR